MVQGKIIKRLLGQPTNDPHADSSLSFDASASQSISRPTFSQSASFSTNSPLTCVDIAPLAVGNFAVIAGEKVFKTLQIDGTTITESHDLRAALYAQDPTHDNTLSAFNDQLNIKAVRWAHDELDTSIVTAAANGRITVYDLNRIQIGSGLEVGRIREHARQVHKLAINPFRGNLLLSASQDGTARFFDIKAPPGRNGMVFHSRAIFKCNADPVRDIKWSPKKGFEFACSTAAGTVQHWDTRKPVAPVLKINAHEGPCMSISWHPAGDYIVSGGLDQQCHVWDLSKDANKRQKPKYTFSTPAPVSMVSWRRPTWSSSAQANRAAQVAVVYDDTNAMKIQNSTMHIWDIARPTLPFKEIPDFETSPTALTWQGPDILWTVGREGEFRQIDVAFAPRVIDRRSLSTFDFSPNGEVLMLLEERQGRPRFSSIGSGEKLSRARLSAGQSSSQGTGGQLSISRSDSEEDTAGSFLGPKPRTKKKNKRRSERSNTPLSTTPPSPDTDILRLEDSLKATGPYKPAQIMAVGHVPSSANRDVFKYLSSCYLQRIAEDIYDASEAGLEGPDMPSRLASIMEYFARSAEIVGQYRLAQTWKILSYTMGLLLTRRAHYHREQRLIRAQAKKLEREKQEKQQLRDDERHEQQRYLFQDRTPTKIPSPRVAVGPKDGRMTPKRTIMPEEESTSGMTTPTARPMKDSLVLDPSTAKPIPKIEQDGFRLPPAAHSTSPTKKNEKQPAEGSYSSTEGYDFYDLDAFPSQAIDIAPPVKKAPLRLDLDIRDADKRPAHMFRHDSNESFQMFSTSAESHPRSPLSSVAGRRQPSNNNLHSSDFDSSWDSSKIGSDPRHRESFDSQTISEPENDYSDPYGISHRPSKASIHRPSIPSIYERDNSDVDEMENSMLAGTIIPPTPPDYDSPSLSILDIDYHPQRGDPGFTLPAIDPHTLVSRTIAFETQTSALNAAIMVLLLLPHLQPNTIDPLLAPAILSTYHQRLQTQSLFASAALLRKLCYPTYPTIYSQSQVKPGGEIAYWCTTCSRPLKKGNLEIGERLQRCERCRVYLEGCVVCWQVEDPGVVTSSSSAQSHANSRANNATEEHEKEHEREHDSESTGADVDVDVEAAGRLYFYCQGCSHGGHARCLRVWHAGPANLEGADQSDGTCPMEGCLHACLPGKWRDERMVERSILRAEELGRAVRESVGVKVGRSGSGRGKSGGVDGEGRRASLDGRERDMQRGLNARERAGRDREKEKERERAVRKDSREVGESRAVESVRTALAGSVGIGGVVLPVPSGGATERKKSVKVVAPGEEQ
jgi:WD40 repeat protein